MQACSSQGYFEYDMMNSVPDSIQELLPKILESYQHSLDSIREEIPESEGRERLDDIGYQLIQWMDQIIIFYGERDE
jgi:hypothetical protein